MGLLPKFMCPSCPKFTCISHRMVLSEQGVLLGAGGEAEHNSPRVWSRSSTRQSRDVATRPALHSSASQGSDICCYPGCRAPEPLPRWPQHTATTHQPHSNPGVPKLSPPASSFTFPCPRPSRSSTHPIARNSRGPSLLLSVTTHWGWCFHNRGCLGQCYRVFVVKHEVLVLVFFPPVRLAHLGSHGQCLQRCLSAPAPGVLPRGTKPRHW